MSREENIVMNLDDSIHKTFIQKNLLFLTLSLFPGVRFKSCFTSLK